MKTAVTFARYREHHGRAGWLAVMLLVVTPPMYPATIVVDETTCTLVDAITAANTDTAAGGCIAGAGADTIELTTNVTLTALDNMTYGPNGTPPVRSDITIEGGGFTIERDAAAPPFRIFMSSGLLSSASLALNDVTVTGGAPGASYNAGMILNTLGSTLIINNSTITGHAAYIGGAILNFSDAPYYSVLFVTNGTLSGNAATRGAAIAQWDFNDDGSGSANVTDSTISDNSASRSGGGLWTYAGPLTVTTSTLSNNSAEFGAGVYSVYGATIVVNSTLSGNDASRNGGGGLFYRAYSSSITNSTLSGNSAGGYGGGVFDSGSRLTLTATIVANSPAGSNCAGFPTDGGGNFYDDGSCPGAAPIVPGVDFDTTLADNGGPTLTHALFPGSVAQDAAGACGLPTDQRGVLRDDGACDSGAFELVATGACCTDGQGTESECIEVTEDECDRAGPQGGLFLGPGTTCDDVVDCTALHVTMDAMSAELTADGVLVRWTTSMEVDTYGFQVLRESGVREKALVPVGQPVIATGGDLFGASYELLDDSREARRARRYFIEDTDLFGRVTLHGPILLERGTRRAAQPCDVPKTSQPLELTRPRRPGPAGGGSRR